jgi:hypothetical protein
MELNSVSSAAVAATRTEPVNCQKEEIKLDDKRAAQSIERDLRSTSPDGQKGQNLDILV